MAPKITSNIKVILRIGNIVQALPDANYKDPKVIAYRPISLLPDNLKVFEKLLLERFGKRTIESKLSV